jgi:uncharacterized protein YjiK
LTNSRYFVLAITALSVSITPQCADDSRTEVVPARLQLGRQTPLSLPGYALPKPTATYSLPAELTEISGLTDIDARTIASVQDEIGTDFSVDLRSGRVTRRTKFGPPGDYEGVTQVDGILWVLRSDGLLIELVARDENLDVGRELQLDIGHEDMEGLGYDSDRGVILVAPKDSPGVDRVQRNQRRVFEVDPATGQQNALPALLTTVDRLIEEAEQAGIALPTRSTRNGRERVDLKVRFSSIAVHPRTQQLYALSAVDGAVLVFDRLGKLRAAHFFDSVELPQLEGMTFLPNGDLVIASEGVDSPSRIQVFPYQAGPPR